MKAYHRTTRANADAILAGGFRDATGHYMTTTDHTGVWIANMPLDENEGAGGDTVLEVSIDEAEIARYEWVQEIGYREWLVPAFVLNTRAVVQLLTEAQINALADARWQGHNPPVPGP